ncbi:MAG: hypothetical protein H0V17_16130 [Deltaproteobacteria bacterium]|nr:hypothetical protein [Deltaproteobacteria bacterium]
MLSSPIKGMLVAVANVWVVSLVVGMVAMWGRDGGSLDTMMMIMVLGLGPGVAVGAIAGLLAGRLESVRRIVLGALGLVSVVILGVVTDPALIRLAIPSTVVSTLVLERWTRENLAVELASRAQSIRPTLSPVWLGIWLGLANAIAVGFVLGLHSATDGGYSHHTRPLSLAVLIGCLGIVPGAGVGAALGCVTKALRDVSPMLRLLVLGVLAMFALVIFLGLPSPGLIGSWYPTPMIPPACVPTLVAVLILERRTRPPERMPAARALA